MTANKFTMKNIFKRLARKADPWQDIEKHACSLKAARKTLDRLVLDGEKK